MRREFSAVPDSSGRCCAINQPGGAPVLESESMIDADLVRGDRLLQQSHVSGSQSHQVPAIRWVV